MIIARNIIIIISILILLPLLSFLILIIIIEDGTPAIFIQERVGIEKKIFNLFKLRTMKKNTQQAGTHDIDQSQILKCGKFIRRLKLDEFPQLFNVLQGDINLVGPRPSLKNQTHLIRERDNIGIFKIRPGITGLSQICGYDMSDPKRLAYVDYLYVQNKSLALDFKIIVSTFTGFFKNHLKRKFDI